eukprot:UN31946
MIVIRLTFFKLSGADILSTGLIWMIIHWLILRYSTLGNSFRLTRIIEILVSFLRIVKPSGLFYFFVFLSSLSGSISRASPFT